MKISTIHIHWKRGCAAILGFMLATAAVHAESLKIGYGDWPGYTVMEIAKQKDWFKKAGVDVELIWFDYSASLDAFAAGKVDGVLCVPTDALVLGSTGIKSKIIAIADYTDGNDKVIAAPGIASMKDLKGKKIAVEIGLVDHLLLLQALKENGMTQNDVTLVPTPTNNTPQVLGSGQVSAVCAWYPISGQVLQQNPGSKDVYNSHNAPGLIHDVLTVNPSSLGKQREDWVKIVQIFYQCVDFLMDPKTHDEGVAIMAARVGVDPKTYEKNLSGTHFMTLAEAKARFQPTEGTDSLHGSMVIGDRFNVENKVYPANEKIPSYLAPSIVRELP